MLLFLALTALIFLVAVLNNPSDFRDSAILELTKGRGFWSDLIWYLCGGSNPDGPFYKPEKEKKVILAVEPWWSEYDIKSENN